MRWYISERLDDNVCEYISLIQCMELQLPEEQTRGWLIREAAETDPGRGMPPHTRSIDERLSHGFVVLDKPFGPTSHQVSAWTRNLFDLRKAGHAGTLDPHVTGVLPVALGTGTKVLQALQQCNKEYVCLLRLHSPVDAERVAETGRSFVGSIEQTPPHMAAVKRQARTRHIYYFDVLAVQETNVLFRIGCEKGTYVRVLCEQFAQALGKKGEMADLRRTRTGCLTEQESVYLQDVRDQYVFWRHGESHAFDNIVRPLEDAVQHLPQVVIKDSAIPSVCHGASLGVTGIASVQTGIVSGDMVAVLSLKNELVSLGKAQLSTQELVEAHNGQAVSTDSVFMDRQTY